MHMLNAIVISCLKARNSACGGDLRGAFRYVSSNSLLQHIFPVLPEVACTSGVLPPGQRQTS